MIWLFSSTNAVAAQNARKAFVMLLELRGSCAARCGDAELVFGELVGNAIRHAPGPIRVCLEWPDEDPVLHVIDEGPQFSLTHVAPADTSESGRGLLIAALLTKSLSLRRIHGRNQVTAVLFASQPYVGPSKPCVPELVLPPTRAA